MDINILTNYSFLVVAAGTVILAIASGMVGTISVLKGQSLIGDAIGHSSFAGIVISFMLFQQRNPIILSLGALF
jgi:manganese/zinc/iron transport system permease protein